MASEYNTNASTVAKKIAASAVASVPSTAAIPEIKAAIERAITNAPVVEGVAVVDIKSAWLSKINATNVAAILAMLGTVLPFFGLDLSFEMQRDILAGVIAVGGFSTVIFKTFFTPTVTPSSLPKAT